MQEVVRSANLGSYTVFFRSLATRGGLTSNRGHATSFEADKLKKEINLCIDNKLLYVRAENVDSRAILRHLALIYR